MDRHWMYKQALQGYKKGTYDKERIRDFVEEDPDGKEDLNVLYLTKAEYKQITGEDY